MRLGILSDTHDHLTNTDAALQIFKAEGITQLLHCGDITTAGVVYRFAGWNVTFVWGNSDKHHAEVEAAAQGVGLAPPRYTQFLTLDGIMLAMTHGHRGLQSLITTQRHRYVLHGHTHRRRDEQIGVTRVINPGSLGGRRPEGRSIAILDTTTDDLRFIDVPEPEA